MDDCKVCTRTVRQKEYCALKSTALEISAALETNGAVFSLAVASSRYTSPL
jgi:hypothetical protein